MPFFPQDFRFATHALKYNSDFLPSKNVCMRSSFERITVQRNICFGLESISIAKNDYSMPFFPQDFRFATRAPKYRVVFLPTKNVCTSCGCLSQCFFNNLNVKRMELLVLLFQAFKKFPNSNPKQREFLNLYEGSCRL